MIALGGVFVILLFVAVLFYLDHRTRKQMKNQALKH
jgi:hypothetical protein